MPRHMARHNAKTWQHRSVSLGVAWLKKAGGPKLKNQKCEGQRNWKLHGSDKRSKPLGSVKKRHGPSTRAA